MNDFVNAGLSATGWAFAFFAAFLLGLAKGGIKGLGSIISIIMALVFSSKISTGIVMPLLIIGDTFAVFYYNRHARWHYLWKLLPWVIAGVFIGTWFGRDLPESQFKIGMAIIILASAGFMCLSEFRRIAKIPDNRLFAAIMGSLAGFTTMVGNLAGPFSELYFLAIRVSKEVFIGTSAWLFFITNLIKLPFHIWTWKTIHFSSLKTDLILLPALLFGIVLGIKIVHRINQQQFRIVLIILTAIGAVFILFQGSMGQNLMLKK